MTTLPHVTMQQDRQEEIARWREGCLATSVWMNDGWKVCMVHRARAHFAAGDDGVAERELQALRIFLNTWHNKP